MVSGLRADVGRLGGARGRRLRGRGSRLRSRRARIDRCRGGRGIAGRLATAAVMLVPAVPFAAAVGRAPGSAVGVDEPAPGLKFEALNGAGPACVLEA